MVFFYKSGMLDYGQRLKNRTPIMAGIIDYLYICVWNSFLLNITLINKGIKNVEKNFQY